MYRYEIWNFALAIVPSVSDYDRITVARLARDERKKKTGGDWHIFYRDVYGGPRKPIKISYNIIRYVHGRLEHVTDI